MTANRRAAGSVALGLLVLTGWCSWQMCGLSGDGAYTLVEILHRGGPIPYAVAPERFLSNVITQIPVALAIETGVTDTRWLARLYSLGLYALPIGLYAAAVLRASRDTVVLALTIAGIAVVFLTTSFAIEAEHNPAHAMAVTAAVWIVTARRLTVCDGLVLLTLAVMALRSYEVFVYLGPLLAALTLWAVRRAPERPAVATTLRLAAAACFVLAALLSLQSILTFEDRPYLTATLREGTRFWRNLAFDLALLVAVVGARFHRLAVGLAVVLALSPLLVIDDWLMRLGFVYFPDIARLPAGGVTAGGIGLLWLHAATLWRPAASRLLGVAVVLFAATVPWFATSAAIFVAYRTEVEDALRGKTGVIAYEDVPLSRRSRASQNDSWQLAYLSLLLRATPGDATVAIARGYHGWLPSIGLPALDGYAWRR